MYGIGEDLFIKSEIKIMNLVGLLRKIKIIFLLQNFLFF